MGIDPGTTAAFAALDLDGNLVAVESARSLGVKELIERLRKTGSPALFACDVRPAPEAVSKIASAFNAGLFSAGNLRGEEKRQLAKGFRYSNEHEMDAIASARKAFHSLENKFRQIDRLMKETGLSAKSDEAKELVLNGTRLDHALLLLKEWEAPAIEIREKKPAEPSRQPLYRKELGELVRANCELSKKIQRLENELGLLKEDLSRARSAAFSHFSRDVELLKKDAEIRRLRALLSSRRGARLKRPHDKKPLERKGPDIQEIISNYREER